MNAHIESKKIHHGRNVKRLREMLGVKQDVLATDLNITQATMSKLEAKEEIEKETLEKIAQALKIPVEAIENFNDEGIVSIIANTYQDESVSYAVHYKCVINPIEKIVELYNEKEALYERMIQEKNELIEKLLNK